MTAPSADPSALSYASSGVNYDQLDAFKRACQQAAGRTVSALAAHGLTEPVGIRGESAYLLEGPDSYLAHVEEGLGTKNLVADAMLAQAGKSFYANVGVDTVATIVNDLVTVGALPVSVAMHAAVGDAAWFEDPRRSVELAKGFADGCLAAGAVWGGGETPTLKGIVDSSTIVLAGSAVGSIRPKSLRIRGDVRDGDKIVFLASSGVQTNGLTLCRKLAERLPQGYLTPIGDGRAYGEALLDASVIYVKAVSELQRAGVTIRYAAHVTGHGWRKLMRLAEPFVYRITDVREPLPIFKFLQQAGPIDVREMYATFNMGVGFAFYVRPDEADQTVDVCRRAGYDAWLAGDVRKQGDRKAVEIPSLGLAYEGDTLQVR
ncbi:MAG TPA: AIR synthase-related protein [Humisphaera sp.]